MDVEIEKPHVHHKPTGRRHLDLILPITALFVVDDHAAGGRQPARPLCILHIHDLLRVGVA